MINDSKSNECIGEEEKSFPLYTCFRFQGDIYRYRYYWKVLERKGQMKC